MNELYPPIHFADERVRLIGNEWVTELYARADVNGDPFDFRMIVAEVPISEVTRRKFYAVALDAFHRAAKRLVPLTPL